MLKMLKGVVSVISALWGNEGDKENHPAAELKFQLDAVPSCTMTQGPKVNKGHKAKKQKVDNTFFLVGWSAISYILVPC